MKTINGIKYFNYTELEIMEQIIYFDKTRRFLQKLVFEYPFFTEWFEGLFNAGFQMKENREILIAEHGSRLAGVAILKKDDAERKICTLRVDKGCRGNGIGKHLMLFSFDWLNTDKPMITLHKSKQKYFNNLLNNYDFRLDQSHYCYYNIFSTELVYNGMLPKKEILINKIEIGSMRNMIFGMLEAGRTDIAEIMEQYFEACQGKALKKQ